MNSLEWFKQISKTEESILTLGGTGPNGCSQIHILEFLGVNQVRSLFRVNIVSGSAFGYFIWIALHRECLKIEAYREYDTLMRRAHNASFINGASFLALRRHRHTALYKNELVRETCNILLDSSLAEAPFSEFDENIRIWAHCRNRGDCIPMSPKTHPDMKVWELLSATASVSWMHGYFNKDDQQLCDPMFSPSSIKMRKLILEDRKPHLYANYKTEKRSRNVVFVQNQKHPFPTARLLIDFIAFACNLPNPSVRRTHQNVLKLFNAPAQPQDSAKSCNLSQTH